MTGKLVARHFNGGADQVIEPGLVDPETDNYTLFLPDEKLVLNPRPTDTGELIFEPERLGSPSWHLTGVYS